MENASKALIIAGAILLAILLISLGIMIFSNAQGAIGDGGMTDAQKTTFNGKFTKYQGDITGAEVLALESEVNVVNADPASVGTVDLTKPDTISKSSKYTVTMSYASGTGLIGTITVTEKN